jgi:hypothetical protein
MQLTKKDIHRLKHINQIMDSLHAKNNSIYEHWVDEEFEIMKIEIKQTISELKKLLNGVKEEF